jgi:hypothetical protein
MKNTKLTKKRRGSKRECEIGVFYFITEEEYAFLRNAQV